MRPPKSAPRSWPSERVLNRVPIQEFCFATPHPCATTIQEILHFTSETWGTPAAVALFAPSRVGDAAFGEALARYQRQSTSPSAIKRLQTANDEIDVRPVLPQVHRPTLIIRP